MYRCARCSVTCPSRHESCCACRSAWGLTRRALPMTTVQFVCEADRRRPDLPPSRLTGRLSDPWCEYRCGRLVRGDGARNEISNRSIESIAVEGRPHSPATSDTVRFSARSRRTPATMSASGGGFLRPLGNRCVSHQVGGSSIGCGPPLRCLTERRPSRSHGRGGSSDSTIECHQEGPVRWTAATGVAD